MQILQLHCMIRPEAVQKAAMSLSLPIAITRLLSENARNIFRGLIRITHISILEASRVQRCGERHGILGPAVIQRHSGGVCLRFRRRHVKHHVAHAGEKRRCSKAKDDDRPMHRQPGARLLNFSPICTSNP